MVKSPLPSPPPTTSNEANIEAHSPAPEAKSSHITIIVCDQAGQEISFKLKRSKELGKLMLAYCEAKSVQNPKDVRFMYDGVRLNGPETPDSMEMMDQDRIDVHLEQLGGALNRRLQALINEELSSSPIANDPVKLTDLRHIIFSGDASASEFQKLRESIIEADPEFSDRFIKNSIEPEWVVAVGAARRAKDYRLNPPVVDTQEQTYEDRDLEKGYNEL